MKDERTHLDADLQGLRLQKWLSAECWIVGDGNVFCDQVAGEKREAHVAKPHLATQRLRQLGFQDGTEVVRVDQKPEEDTDDYHGQDNEPGYLDWTLDCWRLHRGSPTWLVVPLPS